jgi:hypothetical protein
MARHIYFRTASGAAVVALAFVLVGLDALLGGEPNASTGLRSATPPVSVNRSLKGDRLPASNPVVLNAPDWRNEFRAKVDGQLRVPTPVGCDPAFSPISSPRQANVYRRCTV